MQAQSRNPPTHLLRGPQACHLKCHPYDLCFAEMRSWNETSMYPPGKASFQESAPASPGCCVETGAVTVSQAHPPPMPGRHSPSRRMTTPADPV